jgi:hypothetical protein
VPAGIDFNRRHRRGVGLLGAFPLSAFSGCAARECTGDVTIGFAICTMDSDSFPIVPQAKNTANNPRQIVPWDASPGLAALGYDSEAI